MHVREAGLDFGNIWMMPESNGKDPYDQTLDTDIDQGDTFKAMFISSTTLKDPASLDGKYHNVKAITFNRLPSFQKKATRMPDARKRIRILKSGLPRK